MDKIEKAIGVLEIGSSQDVVTLIQPAIKEAVEKGLLPKAAPMEQYEQHWMAMQSVLLTFAKTVEQKL